MSLVTSARIQGTLIAEVGNVTMRVAYSDETEGGPITLITALVMNMDEHWANVESEVAAIKAETPKHLLHNDEELKGNKLYSAVRKADRLRAAGQPVDPDLEKAREILIRLLAVPIKYPTPIFYGAVDRIGYDNYKTAQVSVGFIRPRMAISAPGIDPSVNLENVEIKTTAHDIAFDSCLARVDAFAQAALPKIEQVLWIHDHRGAPQEEQHTKEGLRWTNFLKELGWDPYNLSYAGKGQERTRIADSIYFGHSHESLALQLADVCCSTISFQILESMYNWRRCATPFYRIIQRRVMNDGTPPLYKELATQDASG